MFLQFSSDMSRLQVKSERIVEIEFFSGIKHETVLQIHIPLAYQESKKPQQMRWGFCRQSLWYDSYLFQNFSFHYAAKPVMEDKILNLTLMQDGTPLVLLPGTCLCAVFALVLVSSIMSWELWRSDLHYCIEGYRPDHHRELSGRTLASWLESGL